MPVLLGIGIGLYFSGVAPISPLVLIIFCSVFLVFAFLLRRRSPITQYLFIAATIIIAGYLVATYRVYSLSTPVLEKELKPTNISGWVENVHLYEDGKIRLTLARTEIRGTSPLNLINVRVNKFDEMPYVGDRVKIRAGLMPPPGPSMPGDYDYARQVWFQGLSAVGYAVSPLEITERNENLSRGLSQLRQRMTERIKVALPGEAGTLAAALTTGIRGGMPEQLAEAMRDAGLAHLLAISGLHMGLLCGVVFFSARFLLSLSPNIALKYPIKKWSAVIAGLAGLCYLFISGASIPTIRAFIMVMIVFLGVLTDRKAISLRLVATAATFILVMTPEAIVGVSFQMSFAAVLALVVVYRFWRQHRPKITQTGLVSSLRNNVISLSVTSFVAGTATAGFALFHFGRVAKYGLAGNLLAMPVFTFAVMPLGIVSLLMIPFGLEEWPLALMGYAVSQLVEISTWIASWDGAMLHAKAAPHWVIGLYGLAFILLMLGEIRGRLIAFVLIGISAIGWILHPVPDLRISAEGRIAFWETEDYQRLIVTSERADKYGRGQFSEKAGHVDPEVIAIAKTDVPCDGFGCRIEIKGAAISILNHPSEARIECLTAALVILTQRDVGPEVRRNCKAQLIDGRVLRQQGSMDIYVSRTGAVRQIGSKKPPSKRRPWD